MNQQQCDGPGVRFTLNHNLHNFFLVIQPFQANQCHPYDWICLLTLGDTTRVDPIWVLLHYFFFGCFRMFLVSNHPKSIGQTKPSPLFSTQKNVELRPHRPKICIRGPHLAELPGAAASVAAHPPRLDQHGKLTANVWAVPGADPTT